MKVNNPNIIKFPCIVKREEWEIWRKKAHILGYVGYSEYYTKGKPLLESNPDFNSIEVYNDYFENQNPKTLIYKKLD